MEIKIDSFVLMFLTIGVEALLVALSFFLRTRYGQRHMTFWMAGFAIGTVAHVIGLAVFLGGRHSLAPLMGLFVLAYSLLMLAGTYEREERHLPRWWYVVAAIALVTSPALSWLGFSLAIVTVAPVVLVGTAFVWTGVRLLATQRKSGGAVIAGVGFIAFGLHNFDLPFVVETPWFSAWGIALAMYFEFVMGVGLVMLSLDQVRAEATEGEARQRAIIENAVDAFFRCTSDGTIVHGNAALAKLVEVDRGALEGTVLPQLAGLPGAGREGRVTDLELVWAHGSQRRAVAITAHRFVEGGKELWEGFIRDVTRSRLVDAEQADRRKLEALGRLAGGIAHDFNNLLVVIQGGLLGARVSSDGAEREEMIKDGEEAAARAAELTRQLLDFGKQVKTQVDVSNVRDVFERCARLLVRAMGEKVELAFEGDGLGAWVPVPPTQLTQVLLNLVLNARDAMPKGGRVLVRVGGDEQRVRVDVADTGEGMDEATRRRIFEPFFTTKGATGTGLGLATVRSIVDDAKGTIEVTSEPGKGTTFTVWLPRVAAPRPAREKPVIARKGVRVLVVDDDDGVRRLITRTLVDAGYEVTDVPGATEALDAINRAAFDVLLTDVMMPGTRGPQLANLATASRPNLRVVFISGQPAPEVPGPSRFVSKPFTKEALLTAVAEEMRN